MTVHAIIELSSLDDVLGVEIQMVKTDVLRLEAQLKQSCKAVAAVERCRAELRPGLAKPVAECGAGTARLYREAADLQANAGIIQCILKARCRIVFERDQERG